LKRERFHKCPYCKKIFYSTATSKYIKCPECKKSFENPYLKKGGLPEDYIKGNLADILCDELIDS